MDERILKWVYDIDLALNEIESYFDSEEKDFSKYQKTQCLRGQLKGIWKL